MWIHNLSSDIQRNTLLNIYENHIPSINQQIQCDNQDEYVNRNPEFDHFWLIMRMDNISSDSIQGKTWINLYKNYILSVNQRDNYGEYVNTKCPVSLFLINNVDRYHF